LLWANVLVEGKVVSDETDHLALYKHADKLDAIAKTLSLPSFVRICDTTDQRFNVEDWELPTGMNSTDELMAVQGTWMPVAEAVALLRALRDQILAKNVRFGLLSNQQSQAVAKLDAVLAFLKAQPRQADRFNFSVVM
jgi:hypothetical protein